MKELAETIRGLLSEPEGFDCAFDAGYDYAKNGADETNCNFKWFGSPESTSQWEKGRDTFEIKNRSEGFDSKREAKEAERKSVQEQLDRMSLADKRKFADWVNELIFEISP